MLLDKKILVIDDDETILLSVEMVLEMNGYKASTLNSAENLDSFLNENPVDLILLDLNLGESYGLNILKKLKLNSNFSIPVIMLTGEVSPETLEICFDAGAADFINKPFVPKVLLSRIKSVLSQSDYLKEIQQQKNELIQSEKKTTALLNYIQKDLEKAKQVQARLIPASNVEFNYLKISSYYKPIDQVGGDFFSYKNTDDYTYILFGDVSGHGVASALISCIAVICFQVMRNNYSSLNEDINHIHSALSKYIQSHYITCAYLRYNSKTRILDYCYAAHHPILLIRNNQLIQLEGKGTPMILIPNFITEKYTIQIEKGDKLFLFSDGIFERINNDKVILGYDDFVIYLETILKENPDHFFEIIKKNIEEIDTTITKDDITALLIEL
jgi:sigma-B regulation protein RsbU (phosphoserine phosphatase)